MKIEDVRVFGFEPALHGMRNPMDSWPDSDSFCYDIGGEEFIELFNGEMARVPERPIIGEKDMKLACKLIRRGSEHRKFMRQIMVWMNITIPRYVWQELDTYKVATVRNSCSTMNKLGAKDLEQSDFQHPIPAAQLDNINMLGRILREAKGEGEGVREARVQLKNDLCEGFLQKATYSMSYETVLTAILQRENHRLPEWRKKSEGSIVQTLLALPYMTQFYKAATFKRDQLRSAVADLDQMIEDITQGAGAILPVEKLKDLRAKLKRAA
jgi:hypothetical protein